MEWKAKTTPPPPPTSCSSAASSSSTTTATSSILQSLIKQGWCFRDAAHSESLIADQFSSLGKPCTIDSVELELMNIDLRSIGGKSLPDSPSLRKASHLQGPKVLQVCSVRDISRSSISESSGNSSRRRLLRLKLTDGYSEITAIEFSHLPSFPDDIAPGTKVRLEHKCVVNGGIVCLNSNVITMLGGVVPSLYEEWQMNKKYSGLLRTSLRVSDESAADGPPPFERLQIGRTIKHFHQKNPKSQYMGPTSKSSTFTSVGKGESSSAVQIHGPQNYGTVRDGVDTIEKPTISTVASEEKPTGSEARPKEVAESIPVQNQAAAQKLLQKMSQTNHNTRHARSQGYGGRGKQDEPHLFTLEEWERRKAGADISMRHDLPDVSLDEDLARQLQEQFDMEDIPVQKDSDMTEAEDIRMSMFRFDQNDNTTHGRTGSRGRGRGRGRRGRRGRG